MVVVAIVVVDVVVKVIDKVAVAVGDVAVVAGGRGTCHAPSVKAAVDHGGGNGGGGGNGSCSGCRRGLVARMRSAHQGLQVGWWVEVLAQFPRALALHVIHADGHVIVSRVNGDVVCWVGEATLRGGSGAGSSLELTTYLQVRRKGEGVRR